MPTTPAPTAPRDHVARNVEHWNDVSESYQLLHEEFLPTDKPMWSALATPESSINALGEVRGRQVLDLGCGGAQFAIALARQGASVTAVDISTEQLAFAAERMDEAERLDGVRPDVTLVHGDVEALDLPDASFDIAFSDYGASMFADPTAWVPEAARLVRPGGRLAFSTISPMLETCWPKANTPVTSELVNDYFDLHRIDSYGVQFNLPYGEWIRLFRRTGFDVVDLIENRPADHVLSTAYRTENQIAWSRRWPAENIWVLDRRG